MSLACILRLPPARRPRRVPEREHRALPVTVTIIAISVKLIMSCNGILLWKWMLLLMRCFRVFFFHCSYLSGYIIYMEELESAVSELDVRSRKLSNFWDGWPKFCYLEVLLASEGSLKNIYFYEMIIRIAPYLFFRGCSKRRLND
jgi:hypothetical protein